MLLLAGLLGLVAVGLIVVFMLLNEKTEIPEPTPTEEESDQTSNTEDEVVAARRVDCAEPDEKGEGETPVEHFDDIAVTDELPDTSNMVDTYPVRKATAVMDLDSDEDSLVLVWDDEADQDPEIEVIEDEQNPEMAHVLLNGRVLADIRGGRCLAASDIILLPRSTALAANANPIIASLLKPAKSPERSVAVL